MSRLSLDFSRLYESAGASLAAGDVESAIAAYRGALTLEPANAAAWNNLGIALIKARRYPEAITALHSALALEPAYRRALVNLGKALTAVGRPAEAVEPLRKALAQEPDYVPALVNWGEALAELGELSSAENVLARATLLAPTLVEAQMTLGIVRSMAGRHTGAIAALETAIALGPGHAEAHTNLAHALFLSGNWRAAWPHFEHRFRRPAHRSNLPLPPGIDRWDGRATAPELWLIGEQGLGDQIHFARYAKALSERGHRCVLVCDARIVRLLSSAQLADRVLPFGATPDGQDARWFPLMSLPAWHQTEPATVPFPDSYLAADPARVAQWRTRLGPTDRLRVALAWAGNPVTETGRYAGRSPPLAALAPLFAVADAEFLSLQKGPGEEQLDQVPWSRSIRRFADLDAGAGAFLDTAAVLRCVDVLITSDTAIAHLAGALGVPTWLCLMRHPDWRWMPEGTSTPWYGSMRLFRQATPGDWDGVYRRVAAELRALGSEGRLDHE